MMLELQLKLITYNKYNAIRKISEN